MRPTVVLTAEFPRIATEILSRTCDVVVHPGEGVRDEEEMIEILAEADGAITLVSDPVTRRVLESNRNLAVIGNYAVGVNNIDLEAARELGIIVTNTPDVLTDATADLTLALILAGTRRLIEGDRIMRERAFTGWQPLYLLGTGLQGKRLGIVGLGRIGSAVAHRAEAFGMDVVHASRSTRADCRWRQTSLDDLVTTSHIVSIHVPLTHATHHLFDAARIESMRSDAWLVNTARGPIIDESALVDALEQRVIAGAALDVFEDEPDVHPALIGRNDVVLAPHVGSATVEARTAMAEIAASEVSRVLSGVEPRFRVV